MRLPSFRGSRLIVLAIIAASIPALTVNKSLAACVFAPSAGNDAYICDSGTAASLTDTGGNNSLTFPAGGTGTITGAVTFGGGTDSITMNSGSIGGAVAEGSGIDDFVMSAGNIASLQQGDGYDTFTMTGGTITGAFEDGDMAHQSGGTIGRVDMKLADNFYYLSGNGRILGNLVSGFGKDTIDISGGTIGGNVSVSGGDDSVSVTGGKVGGEVRMSFGNDRFLWDSGGAIFGNILMAEDSDVATLRNLDIATLDAAGNIDGGSGFGSGAPANPSDLLIFDETSADNAAKYKNWETVQLTNGSIFQLNQAFVLGDSGTGTGRFDIDATSSLEVSGATAAISPFTAGALTEVNNAGVIYLSHPGNTDPTDQLMINGNYHGLNGSVVLDTYLGSDGSPSDKLTISGGTADGLTGLGIVNAGGPGAGTTGSGILVVDAINGGSTASGAFALDRAVAAGAYEYLLFRGGVNAGEEDNWYLRSQIVNVPSPPEPTPEPPGAPPPAPPADEGTTPTPPVIIPVDEGSPAPDAPDTSDPPDAAPPVDPVEAPPIVPTPPGGPTTPTNVTPVTDPSDPGTIFVVPPTPGAVAPDASLLAGADAIPLFRLEAANYAVVQPTAAFLMLQALSTFHDRRGEQDLLTEDGDKKGAWIRLLGAQANLGWTGTVAPSFNGTIGGIEGGVDLYDDKTVDGTTQAGVFAGYATATGDVHGFALGWANYDTGSLGLTAFNLGAYATRIDASGWYLDDVAMGTFFSGSATSTRNVGIGISGGGLTASAEAGYPIDFGGGLKLEPQGQLIVQHIGLNDADDPFAKVTFDPSNTVTGRLGARLYDRFETDGGFVQPEVKANFWQTAGDHTVNLDADSLTTHATGSSVELGAGLSGKMDGIGYFAGASYQFGVAGSTETATSIRLGLTGKW